MVIFVRQNVCVKAWSVKGGSRGRGRGNTHCLIYPNAILLWDTVELESLGLGDSLDEEDAKEMEAGLTTVDSDVVKLSWRHWRCPWGNRKPSVGNEWLQWVSAQGWKLWLSLKRLLGIIGKMNCYEEKCGKKREGSRKETQDTELPKCQAEYSWTGGKVIHAIARSRA